MKRILITSALLLNALFAFSQVAYQYDNLNRLQKVTYPNGTTVDYTYDALGNRSSKIVNIPFRTVMVIVNNPIMGSVTGGGNYAINSPVTISATPNSGYRFVKWNDGITQNPRTITVVSDTSFTALFEIIHHVTVLANYTTRGAVTGSGDYAKDSTAIIRATANVGHRFLKWNDGNTSNPRTITVIRDTSFTAIFDVMHQVTVTANYAARGTVTGSGIYAQDSSLTITATANNGHRFLKWDDGNKQNPRTITVTQDISFTAIFEIMHHVTVLANYPAGGTLTGSGDYAKDSSATITAIANTN
jgi:YD repeat-containing protein